MQSCHNRLKKGASDYLLIQTRSSEVFQSRDSKVLLQDLQNSSHVALHQLMFHTDWIYSSSIMFPTNEITLELQLVILFLHLVFENCTAPRFASSNLNLPAV